MFDKFLELLVTFRIRSTDGALKGRMCYTHEAFALAATELEIAIRESRALTPAPQEPPNLIAYIPPACFALVCEAIHFNPHDEEAWERLGLAAIATQSGPS